VLRVVVAALLVLPVSGAAAAPRGEGRADEPSHQRVRTLLAADDPTGDAEAFTGVAADRLGIVDLTRVELQRRGGTVRVAFTLAAPPARNGYYSELWFTARSTRGVHRELQVYAIPQRDIVSTTLWKGPGSPRDCEGEVDVVGSTAVVEVPRACVPGPFRAIVGASANLYVDNDDSEIRLAGDGVVFGQKRFPAVR
jgi:hypothetical protein